jgi:hypothetical protein
MQTKMPTKMPLAEWVISMALGYIVGTAEKCVFGGGGIKP